MTVRGTINTLGYAGLLPFVIAAGLVASGSVYSETAGLIAGSYAFGIICFLTGSWWGMNWAQGNPLVILLSNLYFLLAFLALALFPGWWPLASALLLVTIFVTESTKSLFPTLSVSYRKMRAILTLVSAGSMLSTHLLG